MRGLGAAAGGRVVLSGVSFEARAGEVVGVLGPNGSGKTTLLEALAALRPATGEVLVRGQRLTRFEQRLPLISYLPDEVLLPEEVSLGTALALRASSPLAERLGVAPLLDARATEVSRGESRRAQLCAALALDRPLVLLDEPFATFDPRQLRELLPVFREAIGRRAVLVSIHQLRTAELAADRLLLLSGGRQVAFGTLEALRELAKTPGASLDEVFLTLLEDFSLSPQRRGEGRGEGPR